LKLAATWFTAGGAIDDVITRKLSEIEKNADHLAKMETTTRKLSEIEKNAEHLAKTETTSPNEIL